MPLGTAASPASAPLAGALLLLLPLLAGVRDVRAQAAAAAARAGVSAAAPVTALARAPGVTRSDAGRDSSDLPPGSAAAVGLLSLLGWTSGALVGGWLTQRDGGVACGDGCASGDGTARFGRGVAAGGGVGAALTLGSLGYYYGRCPAGERRLLRAAAGVAAGTLPALVLFLLSDRDGGAASERYEASALVALPVGQLVGGAVALRPCYGPGSR